MPCMDFTVDFIVMENVNVIHVDSSNFEDEVIKCDKPVIVDFSATWCGPCQRLAKVIEQVSTDRPDVKVVKIDIDESGDLATKFFVRSVPTIVIIKNKIETNRHIGFATRDQIISLL